ncbi:hypothetical protein AB1Y20_016646 [Prymnesium parvum]|uniref:Uncharacterized protein n=1 Tax=Prymnesium parvum TaxID=97485 RepID=A0AB34IE04_PRYPA
MKRSASPTPPSASRRGGKRVFHDARAADYDASISPQEHLSKLVEEKTAVWAALFGEKAFELKRKGEDADMLKDHIKRVHEYCKELSKDHKAKLLSLEVKFRHSQAA